MKTAVDGYLNTTQMQIFRINNNYSPKWRWLVLDIYRTAKQWGKYPRLATDRIFTDWVANQSAPKTLSTVLVYTNNGYTPLHRAVMNGAVNLTELLLEHKADANTQHKYGFTPLHLSARFSHKDCNEIIDLLLQYGVQNIDIRDVEGRTPLQMAVRCGNAQAVKKLVDLGADVSLVKADKRDAVELERLYYEAKSVEWKKSTERLQ